MRIRSDLIFVSRIEGDETTWIAKDPVSLTYHFYSAPVYFIIEFLRSSSNIVDLRRSYEDHFETPLTEQELSEHLSVLARDQIILPDDSGDGVRLARLSQAQERKRWSGMLANPLAVKLPGWNFDRILTSFRPVANFLLRPGILWLACVFILLSIMTLIFNWEEFSARLPSARHFFQGQNVILILLCLAITKVFHELAHALTCRAFGAECHEIGVMFLLFTPCMYCDVSDAWMIREKWKRIFIAAAGIFIELTLAAIATFVWCLSEPGFLNTICLNLMFICSVSTLFFNGNPLLRYDGYFILSDLVGIPNLWTRSRAYLGYVAQKWLLGVKEIEPPEKANGLFLVTYGLCSICYRFFLIFVILFFLLNWLVFLKLEIVAFVLLVLVLISQLVKPVLSTIRKLVALLLVGKLKTPRFLLLSSFATGLIVLFFVVPFPNSISVPAYLEFADAKRVYVKTPGVLESFHNYGSQVKVGDLLFELGNPELRLAQSRLHGDLKKNKMVLERLDAMRVWNSEAGSRIPAQQELVASLTTNDANLESRVKDLKSFAEVDGTLIAPRMSNVARKQDDLDRLPFWSEIPLIEKNVGAYFEKGQLMGLVGSPNRFSAIALVRQEFIDLIKTGQKARVQLSGSPHRMADGEVTSLSLMRDDELPTDVKEFLESRFADEIQKSMVESGKIYFAKIELKNVNSGLQFESARVRVQVSHSTLAFRLGRYLKRTFSKLFE